MEKILTYILRFLEQRHGLPWSKRALLILKILEFSLRRLFFPNFVMTDIWGIRHRYSPFDVMGFKTALGVYELEEQVFFWRALQLSDIAGIVDVGSAVGTFTSLFAKYAPEASVYSFEPNPFSNRYQRQQLVLNGLEGRVKVFSMGVGSENVEHSFAYVDGIEGSLWGRFDNATLVGKQKEARVAVNRLDSVEEICAAKQIDLVKLDIEGYELPALLGMTGLLRKHRPVVFCEMALSFLVTYSGNRYLETLDFFYAHDYEIFLLKGGMLSPYTWPEARIMNFILLPKVSDSLFVSAVRKKFVRNT